MYWLIAIVIFVGIAVFIYSFCVAGGIEDRERGKVQHICFNCLSYSIKASIGNNTPSETTGKCINGKVFLMVRPSGLNCIPANKDYGLSLEEYIELSNYMSDYGELRFQGNFGCIYFER